MNDPDPVDVDALLARAAGGELAAQTRLASEVIAQTDQGQLPTGVGLGIAEILARMAVFNGGGIECRRQLCGILYLQSKWSQQMGDPVNVEHYQVETLARATALADEGDQDSADLVNTLADEMTPHTIAIADAKLRSGALNPTNLKEA